MAVAWVIVIARSIQICWHQTYCIKAVLETQRFAELDAGDFGDGIASIGGF